MQELTNLKQTRHSGASSSARLPCKKTGLLSSESRWCIISRTAMQKKLGCCLQSPGGVSSAGQPCKKTGLLSSESRWCIISRTAMQKDWVAVFRVQVIVRVNPQKRTISPIFSALLNVLQPKVTWWCIISLSARSEDKELSV